MVGVLGAIASIEACGLDIGGSGTASVEAGADGAPIDATADAIVGVDATPDSTPADAADADSGFDPAACIAGGGFVCGSTCVTSCVGCSAGNVACNATRVCGPDCAACPTFPYACFDCTGAPRGICYPMKCDAVMGLVDCACTGGDAGACPGATQICTGGGNPQCKTCGSGGTDNKQCGNGRTCKESTATCM